MNKFIHLGCNFTDEHVDTIEELVLYAKDNNKDTTVGRVYGNPPYINPFGSTRPVKRENSWAERGYTIENFKMACQRLHDMGVKVNWTFNSLFPHLRNSKDRMKDNFFDSTKARDLFEEFLYETTGCIDAIILSNPLMIDYIHNHVDESVIPEVMVSTIMEVQHLDQLDWIKNKWPRVKSVCPSLWRNHDLKWMERANAIIPLEPLANEFCSIGGASCSGLYRQACYLGQTLEVKKVNTMSVCISERHNNPLAWIKARYILPQWMEQYRQATGVQNFKVTGRTHTADYVEFIGKTFINESYTGNLTGLWGQLQATNDPKNWHRKQEEQVQRMDIPVEIVEPLINNLLNDGCCDADSCGRACNVRGDMADAVVAYQNELERQERE